MKYNINTLNAPTWPVILIQMAVTPRASRHRPALITNFHDNFRDLQLVFALQHFGAHPFAAFYAIKSFTLCNQYMK